MNFARRLPGRTTMVVVAAALCSPLAWVGSAQALPADPPGCTVDRHSQTNGSDMAIPDADASGVSSSVSVPENKALRWVRVVTHIEHTFANDLDVTLTSPHGTTVTLTTDNGGSADNVFNGTTWEDDAGKVHPPGLVTQTDFDNGVAETPLAPEEPLAAFVGESPLGQWTLNVADDIGGDLGTLRDWTLEYAVNAGAPLEQGSVSIGGGAVTPIPDDGTPLKHFFKRAGQGGVVERVTANVAITHPNPGDLDMHLISPSGTDVTLTHLNGGSNADVFNGTLFTDDAGALNPPGAVTDTVFTSNVVQTKLAPQEPLGAFRGESPNGTWTLTVADVKPGGTGTLGNNVGFSLVYSACKVDVRMTGTGAPAQIQVGQTVAFAFTVVNPGVNPADAVTLKDTLPSGLELVSATPSQGTCSGGVTCSLGQLDPTYPAQVVVVARATAAGSIVNKATVSHSAIDPKPANNTVSLTTDVKPVPVVSAPAGGGTAGGTGSIPTGTPPAADTQAPQLILVAGASPVAGVRKKGLPVLVAATEAGRLKLSLSIDRRTAKRLAIRSAVGSAIRTVSRAGTQKLRVKLTKAAAKALGRAGRLRLTVRGTLTDAAGNAGASKARAVVGR